MEFHTHSEFPIKFESSNVNRDNVNRENGRTLLCCAVLCDRANFRGSAAPRVARYFSAAASAAAAASAEDKRPGAK